MSKTFNVHGTEFKVLIPHNEIKTIIKEVADKIDTDFAGQLPLLLIVLKGAFMFGAQLVESMETQCDIDFIRLKSYQGMASGGKVEKTLYSHTDVVGRDVIIVEDIVDTGNTYSFLHEELLHHGAKSVKMATFLFKPNAYKIDLPVDYVGKEIPNDFVIGFGLDYDEKGRGLPDLYIKAD